MSRLKTQPYQVKIKIDFSEPALILLNVPGAEIEKGAFLMRVKPELDPDVDDEAPTGLDLVTPYDETHYVTYLRLLDAEKAGADWAEVARIVLHRDPAIDETRTRRCWESHLARAPG